MRVPWPGSSMAVSTESFEILRALARHRVDFIVVGMTAAVLQGAPAFTFDLDIIYRIAEDNVQNLLTALREIGAEFRSDAANRRLSPNASHLMSDGHKLLKTKFGLLDVLGTIEERTRYEDLTSDVVTLDVDGVAVQVLELERLIEAKQKAGRQKDMAVLPLLRSTLALIRAGTAAAEK